MTTNTLPPPPPFRVGIGFDIHPFVSGRPLILGGVLIPHNFGLRGHSDADALCHAITDALLGAAGLGDIGRHFPDHDPCYQGANSAELLAQVVEKIHAAGFLIGNVDANIITEYPKISPHINMITTRLATILRINPSQINIKGKTHEKMDAVGEGKALAVQSVVLLYSGK